MRYSKPLNSSNLGEALGVAHTTIRRHIDLLEQTFLVRVLPPCETNEKKRLIKSPKMYIRDHGLLHQLLQIRDYNDLMGNPVFGYSWEGLVVENICSLFTDCRFSFYRSATGDELDLIIQKSDQTIAVECKASTAPQLTKDFWNAIASVQPQTALIVAPVSGSYPIKENVFVCGLPQAVEMIAEKMR